MEYPTDWKKVPTTSQSGTVAFQPPRSIDPNGKSIFQVRIINGSSFGQNESSITPAEYLQKAVGPTRQNTSEVILSNNTDLTSTEGFPAYTFSYLSPAADGVEAGFIANNTVYSMTLDVNHTKEMNFSGQLPYLRFLPQFDHMVGSFTIINDPTAALAATVDAVMSKNPTPVKPNFRSFVLNSVGVFNNQN